MLTSRRFPSPASPVQFERETKPMWSTTATGSFDSTSAANDDVGMLSFHTSACKLANGGLRRVVDTLTAIGSILQSRLITVLVGLTLAAAAAVWLFG